MNRLTFLLFLICGLRILIFAGKSNTSRIIIAIVVPVASVVLVLILFCIYLRVKKPRKENESKSKALNMVLLSFVIKEKYSFN